MPSWRHNQAIRVRLTLISAAILAVATLVAVMAALSWQSTQMERRLRGVAEKEISSLHALVISAMIRRREDGGDVAIGVLNDWFKIRNAQSDGEAWSVWGPKTAQFIGMITPDRPLKLPRDDLDREALSSGHPVARFTSDDNYRYSLPVVMGVSASTANGACKACHSGNMDTENGDVIAVLSTRIPAAAELSELRRTQTATVGFGVALAGLALAGLSLTLRRTLAPLSMQRRKVDKS